MNLLVQTTDSVFDAMLEFLNDNSSFYAHEESAEDCYFLFEVADQEDADVTEAGIREELEAAGFLDFSFELQENEA